MSSNWDTREETRKQAIQIIKDGGNFEQASQATGLKQNYIRQLCNEAGVDWTRFSKSKEVSAKIVELAKQGYAVKEIAEKLSITQATIYKRLREANVKAVRKTQRKLDYEEVRRYFAEGHTAKETAERFGTSKEYAARICRGIRYGNQYTSGLFDREANAIRYINERTPGFEYAGNFTGVDGFVDLKCKTCGTIVTKSFVSVKHGTACCAECARREQEKKEAEKKKLKELQRQELKRIKRLQRETVQISLSVCEVCGAVYIPKSTRMKYCSSKCAHQNKWHMKEGYRKLFPLKEVYERDNGVCYLCGKPCDWNDYEDVDGVIVYGNNYPSRDHVVPKSKGGANDWSNIRLAHRICNCLKADSPLVKN